MAILTSGRTPTVRGALVWPQEVGGKDEEADPTVPRYEYVKNDEHWKETPRAGDYSRMLYAPGDGVILRRSSVTMPGQWGRCLVRGGKDAAANHDGGETSALTQPLTSEEGTVETSHRHVTLLSDVDSVGRCLEACRRARQARENGHM